MKNKKLASFLASAAALALLAVPAFAADELPVEAEAAAEPAAVETVDAGTEAAQPAETSTNTAPQQLETTLPADTAVPAEPAQQITFVALGDSITAGVGLDDMKYSLAPIGFEMKENFEGYSPSCYTAVVADGLGLDRQHAINLGLPGLTTPDMLDMVRDGAMPKMNQASGMYYSYPQYRDYIAKADVIALQIGSNDALVPCIVGLGEATNWKSELLANSFVTGSLRGFNFETFKLLSEGLSRMVLTGEETSATMRLLFHDMDVYCNEAYEDVTTCLPEIIQEIRKLNPDAKILLLGYKNPVPLIPSLNRYFNNINNYAQQLCSQEGLTFIPLSGAQVTADGHPTVRGHRTIGQRIVDALQ